MAGCWALWLDQLLGVVIGPVPGTAHCGAGPRVAGGEAGLAAAPRHLHRGQGGQVQGQQAVQERRHWGNYCEKVKN